MLVLELLLTFAKGILIGLLVSAPMGPTGLLCMRETIRGRRRDGMLVGLGATLSDLVYGFIAYWGVGIVLNLLDQYSSSLRPQVCLQCEEGIWSLCSYALQSLHHPTLPPAVRTTRVRTSCEAPIRRALCSYGGHRYRLPPLVGHPDLYHQETLGPLWHEESRVDQPHRSPRTHHLSTRRDLHLAL